MGVPEWQGLWMPQSVGWTGQWWARLCAPSGWLCGQVLAGGMGFCEKGAPYCLRVLPRGCNTQPITGSHKECTSGV